MDDFDRLRQLLLADELAALERAESRLAALEARQSDLSERLPALVEAAPQAPMSKALASPVASALGSAVRDNSSSIVDALFPVIGPIIRKAIGESLRGLMSDLNSVLEQSFTLRGLKWRLEAWRSGVPYAQVVLKHSLRYRVDHVFLIERDSGLVLHRESSPGLPDLDADAIAGMLTAIGQFVRDSVGHEGGDSLEEARVGEYLLWLLDGPRASIACFIHGVPPESLRTVLSQRLEVIHAWLAAPGRGSIDGEDDVRLLQQALDPAGLITEDAGEDKERKPTSRWPIMLIFLLLLSGLAWYYARIERWQGQVDVLQQKLAAHPGFLLTRLDSKPWRSLEIKGLLDPDADPVEPLLKQTDLAGVDAVLSTEGYLSTDDEVLLRRAIRLLQPPSDVSLSVKGGVLSVRGAAPGEWVRMSHERAAWVAGVRTVQFELSEITDREQVARTALAAIGRELEELQIEFDRDLIPAEGGERKIGEIATRLLHAQELARDAGLSLHFEVEGLNDAPGSDDYNANLRGQRAAWLITRLVAAGVDAGLLQIVDASKHSQSGIISFRGARVRLMSGAGNS